MTDADIYKEVAEAVATKHHIWLHDLCISNVNGIFEAWKIGTMFKFHSHADFVTCIREARAKLAAERDAKDAPRLREENEKMRAIIRRVVDYTSPHLPRMFDEGKKLHAEMTEAIKESP